SCFSMDPTERLNSEALLKHPYMEMHGRNPQYYHGELKQVSGPGGDGYSNNHGTKKKVERNFLQNSQNKPFIINQISTSTLVPRPKYQQQQQQQQSTDRNQTTGTPRNQSSSITPTYFAPTSSSSITPSFNAGRTNWFVPGVVGQSLFNVSKNDSYKKENYLSVCHHHIIIMNLNFSKLLRINFNCCLNVNKT
ncbi:unnamed protein product, partial [Schistosoma turkestanicum]